jgi:hypothetical protein
MQAQEIVRALHAGQHRVDGVGLITRGRGRAGEVVNFIERLADRQRIANVVAEEGKTRMIFERRYIGRLTGEEAVEADDPVAFGKQRFA